MNRQKRKGQSIVEFVMILPVFFLIFFGIFECARAFYVYSVTTRMAREAARDLSVQVYDVGSMTTYAENYVVDQSQAIQMYTTPKINHGNVVVTIPQKDMLNSEPIEVAVMGIKYDSLIPGMDFMQIATRGTAYYENPVDPGVSSPASPIIPPDPIFPDTDGDGMTDDVDPFPRDADNDGVDDDDEDDDGDGVRNADDRFPDDPGESKDFDHDGIGDNADDDDDNDGIPDDVDPFTKLNDMNNNGVDDQDEDSDADGFSDYEEYRAGSDVFNPADFPKDPIAG